MITVLLSLRHRRRSNCLEPDLDDAVPGGGDEVPVLRLAQRQARYPVVMPLVDK